MNRLKSCPKTLLYHLAINRMLLMIVAPLLMVMSAEGQTLNPHVWKNVQIKGGGFVSGIITHPNAAGVIYCRTDIGGAYLWNLTNNSWIPLLDFAADANIYGVESLAIDPSDSNRLYIATSRGSPAVFLSSTNRGATFSSFTPPFSLNGNVDGRNAGERLAVDPNSNNVLFYGSRGSGLYKSVNYGATWSLVGGFPVNSTANSVGLVFVEFIKSSGTPGSATPTIFVGVSQGGNSLYRTTDGGVTWTNITTDAPSNMMAHHAAQDGLGNMYVTFNDNQGPNNITTGRVHKINLTTLVVSNVTPSIPSGAQGGFAGVSVDRQNPNTVVVSTMDRWWAPDPLPKWDSIYRSVNGGTSWILIGSNSLPTSTSAPWSVARSPHWAGDVEIDPYNSNRVFFITGYGVIGSTNLTSGSVNFAFMNDGLEETVPLGLASPPSGPYLLSGHGDIGAFRHNDLDVSPPLADYFSTHRVTSLGIDFAESNPNRIVRLFSEAPSGAYSANGGNTWQDFATVPPGVTGDNRGNIAISADGNRIVWIPQSATGPFYSTNNGANWTASTGGPSGTRVPFSDRVNSNKFYIYSSASGGRIYISTNGGVTFGQGAVISSGTAPRAVFGREGHIWLPRGTSGLSRSINSGTNFTTVSSVQQASFIGFGMAAPGQSYPAIFISGRVGGVDGIYCSDNEGISWTRINDSQHQFGLGSIHVFCADPRVYGRVYFGTEGRGIIYGDPLVVNLTSPSNTATFAANAPVTIIVTNNALSGGVTNVEFYADNGLIGSDAVTPYTLVVSNLAIGVRALKAVAVDQAGARATSGVVNVTIEFVNTSPVFADISDQTVNVGQTFAFTASVTDTDAPPQTLTFTLLTGPTNATLDAGTGAFSWRALVTHSATTNLFSLKVADNGTPSLSTTQNFFIIVNLLTQPSLSLATSGGGAVRLTFSGMTGPDYAVQASTNLVDWSAVFTTNSPAMPFDWTDANAAVFPMRFYRLIVGPLLP